MSVMLGATGALGLMDQVINSVPPPDALIGNVIYLANFADIPDSTLRGDLSRHQFNAQIAAGPSEPLFSETESKVLGGELVHPNTNRFSFLKPSDEPLLDIGTGDMCAEGWFEENTAARQNFKSYFEQYDGTPNKSWTVQPDGSEVKWSLSQNGSSSSYTGMGSDSFPVADTYTHLAFVKVGTSMAWYVNGVRRAGRAYGDLHETNQPFGFEANGKWKSVRYTAGHSRYGYVSSFTLPTGPEYDYRFPLTA